jgi:predicted Rossmann fold flavoprotein
VLSDDAGMDRTCNLAVIGAGAAGLAAAIFAAEAGQNGIVVLDGAAKIGAKILISGGGRCNVTHDVVRPDDFNGARPIVRNILAAFDEQATVRWFASLGVPLKREDTGKLFPVSDSARTVLDALLQRCAALGVAVRSHHRVADVVQSADASFKVVHQHGALQAAQVIMATGGCSVPRTGSNGGGWEIVRRLGHTVIPPFPALVPLVLQGGFHTALSGLSSLIELSTFADGALIDRRTGSLLWTHFGISGPVVMDASRHWVIADARRQRVEMRCNFLPGHDFERVERMLIDAAAARPRAAVQRLVAERLPDRLAAALLASAGIDRAARIAHLSRPQRRVLVHTLTAFVLPVVRARGWDFAEVTAGGVPLAEIDYRTMASRKVRGLYLVGEMLDCDGRIGGFNFQWAWSTGYLAGSAAARNARAQPPPRRVLNA